MICWEHGPLREDAWNSTWYFSKSLVSASGKSTIGSKMQGLQRHFYGYEISSLLPDTDTSCTWPGHFCCQPGLSGCPRSAGALRSWILSSDAFSVGSGPWWSRRSGRHPRPACSGPVATHSPLIKEKVFHELRSCLVKWGLHLKEGSCVSQSPSADTGKEENLFRLPQRHQSSMMPWL